LLPDITRAIRAPRALAVPYPLGYPLGEPGNIEMQRSILRELLRLCLRDDVPILAS
jgi:hypothetical protein